MSTYCDRARKNTTTSRDLQRIWFSFKNMQVKTLNSRCDFQRTAQAEVDAAKEQEMTSMGPVSFPRFLEEESSVDLRQNAWKAWLHGDILTRLVYLPAEGREFINRVCRLADTDDDAESGLRKIKTFKVKRFCTCRPLFSLQNTT